ncbi:aminotransferase class I/II-fold pyridoxal phosphate-dependent enzyme [Candidatus Latescibacterota bacterium]
MLIRRFIMEEWLASYKDTCRYNLGESGVPGITVGELLTRAGETPDILRNIPLTDHDTRGTDRLRAAIAATYSQDITSETITVTTGTSEALFILFNLLLDGRRAVVLPFPAFQALYEVPRALGAEVRFYHLTPRNGYIPDPEEVTGLIDDRTGVVVVNTPHNPSGAAIPAEHAEAIIDCAERHGATVLFDEHYRFLPHEGASPSRSFARPEQGVLAVGSLTKCFGVTGLRVGWIAAPPRLIKAVCDFRDYLTHTLSPVCDYLAARALEERNRFIPPVIEVIRENVAVLDRFITAHPRWSWTVPDGGVVAFPGYDYPVDSQVFARNLVERYGVFVLPGVAFETTGHVRINLSQPPVLFREALDRISGFCLSLEE